MCYILLIFLASKIDKNLLGGIQIKSCTLIPIPELEKWRIGVLLDAIDNLNEICSIEDFDKAMTKDIINYVCNS